MLIKNYDGTFRMSIQINYVKDVINRLESCDTYKDKVEYVKATYNNLMTSGLCDSLSISLIDDRRKEKLRIMQEYVDIMEKIKAYLN